MDGVAVAPGPSFSDVVEQLLERDQYAVAADEKGRILVGALEDLTAYHRARCVEYRRILDATAPRPIPASTVADLPYLPVSLFKWLDLASVPSGSVFKVMTSSGTTGQTPSRVVLDVETARLQSRALGSIVTHYVGRGRIPMLIVDEAGTVRDRRRLSARAAGILGMSTFGRDHFFALDGEMRVDRPGLSRWLERHAGEDLLVFGFTFMIWQYLLQAVGPDAIDLSRATLIHSGGWKKLAELSIDRETFRGRLRDAFGLTRIHDFYGMVEQVGSVFFECPAGYFHPPDFADVLVRDPTTWRPSDVGRAGVLEVVSLLPRSYPGHVLLTEDLGVVHGVDDCTCGRLGSRFTISGRIPRAEIRGCSDTHEPRH